MLPLTPSLLCANALTLGETITECNALDISWYHMDVMDGRFVPNFAIGTDYFKNIAESTNHELYAHMMVQDPSRYIDFFADLGASYYCFHIETTNNPFRLCNQIHAAGMKVGIALNPITEVEVLSNLLNLCDVVTLMSIEPGFSGQSFLTHTFEKIGQLKRMISNKPVLIEVDGGADFNLSKQCLEAGADRVVGGYFTLFNGKDTITNNFYEFNKLWKED